MVKKKEKENNGYLLHCALLQKKRPPESMIDKGDASSVSLDDIKKVRTDNNSA